MKNESASNPASLGLGVEEAAEETPIQRDVIEGTLGQDGNAEPSPAAKHFLVRGKSAGPLKKPADTFIETIIGHDDRARILETTKQPWRMICSLDIEAPFGNFFGTGWLVGPKTVLTAGHCVYDAVQMGGWARKIRLSPGRNGDEKPFDSVESEKFTSIDTWLSTQNPDFDVGCIHLDTAIGLTTGWFSIGALPDADLQDALVNISGYPADKSDGAEQWFDANRVLRVGPRRIFYDVDTYGGQSGAPVWIYEKGSNQPLAVAIHAYGTSGTPEEFRITANSAPRILPDLLQQIRTWIDADSK